MGIDMKSKRSGFVWGAALAAFLSISTGAGTAGSPEKIVLSPLGVVDTVKEGSIAAKAGVKPGDKVTKLNEQANPLLEEVLAYRFDWENAKDTSLSLKRGSEIVAARLPQGDWGIEFRADLSGKALETLARAREQVEKGQGWEEGLGKWKALADEAERTGSTDAASWLKLELGEALREERRWKEAEELLESVTRAGAPSEARPISSPQAPGSRRDAAPAVDRKTAETEAFWTFAATLQMAQTLKGAGENAKAAEAFARASELARAGGLELRLAGALDAWSVFERGRGRLDEAKARAGEALGIRERLAPGSLAEAVSLNSLGNVAIGQGDWAIARERHLKALAIRERLAPDSLDVAMSLNNLGTAARHQGDLAAAREYHVKALEIKERLAPGSLDVATCLGNLGAVAYEQGDWAVAREYHTRALEIRERLVPGSLDVAKSLNNLGVVEDAQGDPAAARAYYSKALEIKERLAPDSLIVAASLNNLGAVAHSQGDLAAAGEYHRKALAIYERLAPGGLDVAMSLHNLGNVADDRGDLAAAREYQLKALEIQERLAPGSLSAATSLKGLAEVQRKSGNLSGCAELLAKAVDTLEAQRGKAGGESARTSFSAAHGDFYSDLIAAYLDTKKPELALETLERSRARSLLEMISSRWIEFKGEVPEALIAKQRELARQRKTLYDKLAEADAKTDPKGIETWRSGLLLLPQKEDSLAEEIRKASPRMAALEYPAPLKYGQMARTLAPGEILIAFSVAEKETCLFALRLGEDSKPTLRVSRLPLGKKVLEGRVRLFRALLGPDAASGADPGSWKRPARELYEALLGPASREIASSQRILLMPDGPLHLLPFGALLPGGRKALPIGLQKPISVIPSMTVYAELKSGARKATGKGERWFGFGDPLYPSISVTGNDAPMGPGGQPTRGRALSPLPGTRAEIEKIALLFDGEARSFLGAAATKAAAKSLPHGATLVHFACHGLIDDAFPMNSALALTPEPPKKVNKPASVLEERDDGMLQAWEVIQDVKLDADCVVLSACDTGTGKIMGGEGVVGLTRAFFYAGAKSVVVSLWPISDESTALLMERFYAEILKGAPRDVALQRAQLALYESGTPRSSKSFYLSPALQLASSPAPSFSHPFYWAAFELHGRGR